MEKLQVNAEGKVETEAEFKERKEELIASLDAISKKRKYPFVSYMRCFIDLTDPEIEKGYIDGVFYNSRRLVFLLGRHLMSSLGELMSPKNLDSACKSDSLERIKLGGVLMRSIHYVLGEAIRRNVDYENWEESGV